MANQMDVYAPLYGGNNNNYHWFDFISSQSTMHRAMSFSLDNAFVEDVDLRVINILSEIKMNYEMAEDSETKQKLWKNLYCHITKWLCFRNNDYKLSSIKNNVFTTKIS